MGEDETTETSGIIDQGRRIGPYRLVQIAGRGGTATVYEAIDERINRVVALKLLAPGIHNSGDSWKALVARMQREAQAIVRLSNPHIATIYEAGCFTPETPETAVHYIAMEMLRGETLRRRLDRVERLTPEEAAPLLEQMALGLDAVHAAGVIHRDIKPSNLMLAEPDDTVKLMDFGVARFTDDATITQQGMMVGSPAYMAPELMLGEAATPASDLWALAVVLYEMLAGQQPFTGENIHAVYFQVLNATPAPIKGLSAPLQAVLNRALSRDPKDRYASGQEMAQAFRDALGNAPPRRPSPPPPAAGLATSVPQTPPVAERRPRRPKCAWAFPIAGFAAIGLVGLAGMLLSKPGTQAAATEKQPKPVAAKSNEAVKVTGTTGTSGSLARRQPITPKQPKKTAPTAVLPPPPGPDRGDTGTASSDALPDTAKAAVLASKPPAPFYASEVTASENTPKPPAQRTAQRPKIVTPAMQVRMAQAATPSPESPASPSSVPASIPVPLPSPTVSEQHLETQPVVPVEPIAPRTAEPPPATPASGSASATSDEVSRIQESLAGVWRGTHARHPAQLRLDAPDENGRFQGTLRVRMPNGPVFIAISGTLSDDGTLTFAEERLLRGADRSAWRLGSYQGSIDPTTGNIEGRGRNPEGGRYNFVFRR